MSVINPQPITCEGHEFSSIKEFANYYGLNYAKVQHYRKLGKTPEEIVRECQFSAASKHSLLGEPKESGNRILCEYDGVKYDSIYEAATALGLSPSQVYDFRKRYHLTPSAAIELAMERRKGVKRPSAVAKKCVINGVEYESREAAIKAYHLPRITVYSRMEREHISFEEALLRGHRESTYCPPTASLFPSLRLVPSKAPLQQPILEEMDASLRYYNVPVQHLRDMITFLPVLLADNTTYLFFSHEARGLEIVSVLPFSLDLETINTLNAAYACSKLAYNTTTGQLLLTGFQMAKETGQDIKPLLFAYFSVASILEQLIRRFGESDLTKEDAAEEG